MNNPYIEARRKQLNQRIADLVFLLNELEKENPIYHDYHKIDTYFEYRIAQYQHSKPHVTNESK